MAVLCAAHHSVQRCVHVDFGVQVGVLWIDEFEMSEVSNESPVTEKVVVALAVTGTARASVIGHVALAFAVICATQVLFIENITSTPSLICVAPSEQCSPACTMESVTGVTSDTVMVNPQHFFTVAAVSAQRIVGSLLPGTDRCRVRPC